MFHVIYRWRIHPGQEEAFEAAWEEATRLIRTHRGGLGSILNRTPDGSYLAFARWPDEATWEKSAAIRLPENTAFDRMAAATISREEPLRLSQVRDLLGAAL